MQFDTSVLAASALEYIWQAEHVDGSVAPVLPEYVLTPQSAQSVGPGTALYLPATHSTHDPPSRPVAPALHAQAVWTVLAAGECEFSEHSRHVVCVTAPSRAEYVLDSQLVHGADPARALYFPGTHNAHAPPLGPVVPALHAQAVAAALPAAELEFVGHGAHVRESCAPVYTENVPGAQESQLWSPDTRLYFPATQLSHWPPLSPVKPGPQMQSVCTALPDGELESAGQAVQVETAVAAVRSEYVPGPQASQLSSPDAILYVPVSHAVHGPPSAPA